MSRDTATPDLVLTPGYDISNAKEGEVVELKMIEVKKGKH